MPSDTSRGFFLKSAVNVFASFVAKVQKHMEKPILLVAFDTLGRFFGNFNLSKIALFWEKLKMPSYSNIFQPETSFRTQIIDLENEDKKRDYAFLLQII